MDTNTTPAPLQCTSCGQTLTRDIVYCPACEFPSIYHVDHSVPAEFRHIPTGGPGATGRIMDMVYHIEGAFVPVLRFDLHHYKIYFEHHVLLWKDEPVDISARAMPGIGSRIIAGLPIFLTQARGPGRIAFSRDGVGQVIPIHLHGGEELQVRKHSWLAATDNIAYTYRRVRGFKNIFFGGAGFFMDEFSLGSGEGVLFLHGYGNVFQATLDRNQTILVEPGGFLYKDTSVQMDTVFTNLSTGFFASAGLTMQRFTGPGRLGIQSMYLHMPGATPTGS